MAEPQRTDPELTPAELLADKVSSARRVMLWERVWPALVPPAAVVALFLSVSWFGLWLDAPRWGRAAGVALFGALLLWSLVGLFRVKAAAEAEARAKLDRDSGIPHRPGRSDERHAVVRAGRYVASDLGTASEARSRHGGSTQGRCAGPGPAASRSTCASLRAARSACRRSLCCRSRPHEPGDCRFPVEPASRSGAGAPTRCLARPPRLHRPSAAIPGAQPGHRSADSDWSGASACQFDACSEGLAGRWRFSRGDGRAPGGRGRVRSPRTRSRSVSPLPVPAKLSSSGTAPCSVASP